MLRARRVNCTLYPACDQYVDDLMTNSQDVTMSAAEQEKPFGSTDSLRGLYSDDVGSQLLLPESSLGMEGMQTTGIVSVGAHPIHAMDVWRTEPLEIWYDIKSLSLKESIYWYWIDKPLA